MKIFKLKIFIVMIEILTMKILINFNTYRFCFFPVFFFGTALFFYCMVTKHLQTQIVLAHPLNLLQSMVLFLLPSKNIQV